MGKNRLVLGQVKLIKSDNYNNAGTTKKKRCPALNGCIVDNKMRWDAAEKLSK